VLFEAGSKKEASNAYPIENKPVMKITNPMTSTTCSAEEIG